jgi:uncharacterized Zn finger protein (UPF0148 family)
MSGFRKYVHKLIYKLIDIIVYITNIKMNFCSSCGSKLLDGRCDQCGIDHVKKNAYVYIVTCECKNDDARSCQECKMAPVPMSREEFADHINKTAEKFKEVSKREFALRCQVKNLQRLANNLNGGNCSCTAFSVCAPCGRYYD